MKFLDEVISIDKEAKRLKSEGVDIIIALGYCNTGCGVLKRGVQNVKDFCIRINISQGNH